MVRPPRIPRNEQDAKRIKLHSYMNFIIICYVVMVLINVIQFSKANNYHVKHRTDITGVEEVLLKDVSFGPVIFNPNLFSKRIYFNYPDVYDVVDDRIKAHKRLLEVDSEVYYDAWKKKQIN